MRGRPLGSGQKLEERRLRAVKEALKSDESAASIARRYKVEVGTLYRWIGKYRRNKKSGLKSRATPGRPKRLTDAQLVKLSKIIVDGAQAAGYPNDLWTCARITELIERRFGVKYHFNHVGKILIRIGFSPQRPEKRAIERDDRRIRKWVRHELPEIKKKPKS